MVQKLHARHHSVAMVQKLHARHHSVAMVQKLHARHHSVAMVQKLIMYLTHAQRHSVAMVQKLHARHQYDRSPYSVIPRTFCTVYKHVDVCMSVHLSVPPCMYAYGLHLRATKASSSLCPILLLLGYTLYWWV